MFVLKPALGGKWALLKKVLYLMDLYHIWLTIIKVVIVRPYIWQKLIRLGFRGNLLNIIRSMYDCIKSRIKVSNTLSNEFSCMLGVRRVDYLSPLLFSLYFND